MFLQKKYWGAETQQHPFLCQANMTLHSFRALLMRELQLTRHHDLRLVLLDGTLLTESENEKPLCTVLLKPGA